MRVPLGVTCRLGVARLGEGVGLSCRGAQVAGHGRTMTGVCCGAGGLGVFPHCLWLGLHLPLSKTACEELRSWRERLERFAVVGVLLGW